MVCFVYYKDTVPQCELELEQINDSGCILFRVATQVVLLASG